MVLGYRVFCFTGNYPAVFAVLLHTMPCTALRLPPYRSPIGFGKSRTYRPSSPEGSALSNRPSYDPAEPSTDQLALAGALPPIFSRCSPESGWRWRERSAPAAATAVSAREESRTRQLSGKTIERQGVDGEEKLFESCWRQEVGAERGGRGQKRIERSDRGRGLSNVRRRYLGVDWAQWQRVLICRSSTSFLDEMTGSYSFHSALSENQVIGSPAILRYSTP